MNSHLNHLLFESGSWHILTPKSVFIASYGFKILKEKSMVKNRVVSTNVYSDCAYKHTPKCCRLMGAPTMFLLCSAHIQHFSPFPGSMLMSWAGKVMQLWKGWEPNFILCLSWLSCCCLHSTESLALRLVCSSGNFWMHLNLCVWKYIRRNYASEQLKANQLV